MSLRVLIADGDPAVRAGLERIVSAAGHRVFGANDRGECERRLAAEAFDVLLIDVGLFEARTARPSLPAVIVLATTVQLPNAVEALRQGANDLLHKPLGRDVVLAALERISRAQRDRRDPAATTFAPLLGSSPAIRRLLEQVERVARTPHTTVLLCGEPGVETEHVARAVHQRSARSRAPFVVCRCVASGAASIANELFGTADIEGALAAAEGGTIFLDAIDELDLPVQAALLRLLQDRVYRPLGAQHERRADVRVIAAARRSLEKQVEKGVFREDLLYRVNVQSLVVPALRERGDDVLAIARERLARRAAECGRRMQGFTARAEDALRRHRWPGNVRELDNALERAVLFAREDRVDEGDLALSVDANVLALGDRSLRTVEEALIRRVLAEVGGNKSRAAQVLGIHRATLHNKLHSLAIDA